MPQQESDGRTNRIALALAVTRLRAVVLNILVFGTRLAGFIGEEMLGLLERMAFWRWHGRQANGGLEIEGAQMTLKLGINGFGRIGRAILRSVMARGDADLEVVAINDPAPAETLAHLFEFDSLHGRFPRPVRVANGVLDVGGTPIRITGHDAPEDLPWGDIDVALECSGQFTAPAHALRHIENGARKVLLSAPATGDAKTVVFGVNHHIIEAADKLISNASCTTNCLVPVAQVLHETFGIERGMMTTVHCYTSTQVTQDAPHADLYRARAAGLSMIPTSTGAAETLGLVLPELAGRITGHAIRVPTPNVSCIDLVVDLASVTTIEDINDTFSHAARNRHAGIIDTTERKLVSVDFRQDIHSAIVACDQTRLQGRMARVLAWYDNEWGFAQRMIDTARVMGHPAD
jgi:glyceraldehyde 3-phosphate dehydrogenase